MTGRPEILELVSFLAFALSLLAYGVATAWLVVLTPNFKRRKPWPGFLPNLLFFGIDELLEIIGQARRSATQPSVLRTAWIVLGLQGLWFASFALFAVLVFSRR